MTGAARRMFGIIAVTAAGMGVGLAVLSSRGRTGHDSTAAEHESMPSSTTTANAGQSPRTRPASGEDETNIPRPTGERPPLPSLPGSQARSPRALSIMRPKDISTPPTPPKPQEIAIGRQLSTVLERHPGSELMFVVCEQGTPPCRARLQARELDTVLAMSREVSSSFEGRVGIKVHEHTDAFTGRYFRAELEVDTSDVRAVPTGIEAFP